MVDPDAVFRRLLAHYGPQGWWPATSRFEVIVGALLMAQTAWRNVEVSIANLRRAGLLTPRALAEAPIPRIRPLVRPAGLYRTKTKRLRAFCRHLLEISDGDLDRFFRRDPATVREELLALDGVGPETADSILLYAGDVPTFVVDAYTVRIGRRLGLFDSERHADVKRYFEVAMEPDVGAYQEFHALLVAHAKTLCRPRPRCDACPLREGCAHARRFR